jgi:hypothetical protein
MLFSSSLNLASMRIPTDRRTRPANAEVHTYFGQEILWCAAHLHVQKNCGCGRHLDAATLEPYRQLGDQPVDDIFRLLDEEGRGVKAGDDILHAAEEAYNARHSQSNPSKADEALVDFYRHYRTVPSWVDWNQVEAGQQVFLAYLPAISYSLYYRSLVPGFSIPKISAVLTATAYLAPPSSEERVQQRLLDTGAFLALLCATTSTATGAEDGCSKALLPGGEGWKAAMHVRFLHAKVRRALLRRKGEREWKTAELGVPINQEDMAATLLAFSTNALVGVEYIAGAPLPVSEQRDYTHFWRYVGWMLGVETEDDVDRSSALDSRAQLRPLDPCGPGWLPKQQDSIAHSYATLSSISFHILHPDKSSVKIAHHLLRMGRRDELERKIEKGKKKLSTDEHDHIFYFRALQCRLFVGDPLADALELPCHPVWHRRIWQRLKSTLVLCVLRIYTLAALPRSPFRCSIVKYHRSNMDTFAQYWRGSHTETMSKELTKQGAQGPFAKVAQYWRGSHTETMSKDLTKQDVHGGWSLSV